MYSVVYLEVHTATHFKEPIYVKMFEFIFYSFFIDLNKNMTCSLSSYLIYKTYYCM